MNFLKILAAPFPRLQLSLTILLCLIILIETISCQRTLKPKEEMVILSPNRDVLNYELDLAQRQLELLNLKILQLKEKIALEEIQQIRQKINNLRKLSESHFVSLEENIQIFDRDREILDQIINLNPSLASIAQEALDEILILITFLKNNGSKEVIFD